MNEGATADFPDVTCTGATKAALKCEHPDWPKPWWVPRSVIHDDSEVYDADEHSEGKLVVAYWFAEKENKL